MRTVIQRVKKATVTIGDVQRSSIGHGMLVLLGVENTDTDDDVKWLCKKIIGLRIFDDERGVMNHSVTEASGEILVVSQFTLYASVKKGNRPSYVRASNPDFAVSMYEKFIKTLQAEVGKIVQVGEFRANMQVSLVNDGPVTIIIDTKNKDF